MLWYPYRAATGPHFVPGLPHVTLIELRLALISYQGYRILLLTLAGPARRCHNPCRVLACAANPTLLKPRLCTGHSIAAGESTFEEQPVSHGWRTGGAESPPKPFLLAGRRVQVVYGEADEPQPQGAGAQQEEQGARHAAGEHSYQDLGVTPCGARLGIRKR